MRAALVVHRIVPDTNTNPMPLDRLQPSQLYISAEKLCKVMAALDPRKPWSLGPVPIRRLGNHTILTDGHTRAFVAWSSGLDRVPVFWDEDDLDWDAYEMCVVWCEQEGIHTAADLKDRVVDAATYQALWLDRCAEMHRALDRKRDQENRQRPQAEQRRKPR